MQRIKVWDIERRELIQNYNVLPQHLPENIPFTCFYSDVAREFIVGGSKFVVMRCCPQQKADLTDGETHTRAISVVLYNDLFDCVVTCGVDSLIMVHEVWTGRRLNLVKMAHSRRVNAQTVRVEITAACFDPYKQLLLTGAHDGSLKVWDFKTGFCKRKLSITRNAEVTAVFWITGEFGNRLIAVGWNRYVTEFADEKVKTEFPNGKEWDIHHEDEILCAVITGTQCMMTTTFTGELIFWNLYTGQPWRKYNANDPTKSIRLVYRGFERLTTTDSTERFGLEDERTVKRKSVRFSSKLTTRNSAVVKSRINLSAIPLPSTACTVGFKGLSIRSLLFLEARPRSRDYGTALTALNNGKIYMWSHALDGGYLDYFTAVHVAGDSVCSMATDSTNTYLFTGTASGYLKIWLMTNFGYVLLMIYSQ